MLGCKSKEIIAFFLAVVAAAVGVIALFMPPQGEVAESVLILVGQYLLFIATLLGVNGALEMHAERLRHRRNYETDVGVNREKSLP